MMQDPGEPPATGREMNPTTTQHGVDRFLARSTPNRRGMVLCLAGGGYRAALFHLGATRRLNELGILARIETITSVSGGSIFAGHLAKHVSELAAPWPPAGGKLPDWDRGVAEPMRRLARKDIRTGPLLKRFDPRQQFDPAFATDALARNYEEVFGRVPIADMPIRPRFVFCAADMQFGDQWVIDPAMKRIGSSRAGYLAPPYPGWTLARAIAASSCVPGVFPPMPVVHRPEEYRDGTYRGSDRTDRLEQIDLVDGGLFDNLGVEPVWQDHDVVLVSDAAPSYEMFQSRNLPWRWLWKLFRHPVILLDQRTVVRKRWLISSFIAGEMRGAYWNVGSLPEHYDSPLAPDLPSYPDSLVERFISRIRIDLDPHSAGEIAILENHGYLMAEIAIRRHLPDLVAGNAAPFRVPNQEWIDANRASRTLRDSHRYRPLRRRWFG